MTGIGFYHLTRTGALQALPRLLGRTLDAGQRAAVLCPGTPGPAAVSAALWDSIAPDWLPHGGAGPGSGPGVGRPEWQPIWLTADPAEPAPNGAQFLFLLGDAPYPPGFDRIFDLFDGNNEEEVRQARARWAGAKAAGHSLTYWQQGERGWVAKA